MKELDLTRKLIEIQSYSGAESELAAFITSWFKERNIDSFLQDGNLIVRFEGIDRNRSFIFNSHMDTVSIKDEDETLWRHGPWNPTMEDDKLVGLGASDMKSGLAASMMVAETIALTGKPPVDLWFTYVIREEQDGSGTASFAEWFTKNGFLQKYKEVAAIFTEPTSLSEIEHGHRGNYFVRAVAQGDSGHSAEPNKIKVHSVRKMIQFADALQEEALKWKNEFKGGIFTPPTVGELTSIEAGTLQSPNKFPASCTATFDIRTTPNFHRTAWERITTIAERNGVEISLTFPQAPAGYTDPNAKIIYIARQTLPNSTLTVSQRSADLGFLTAYGIKAIILGPGEKNQAHETNEFCYISKISQAVQIYQTILNGWAEAINDLH